MLALLGVISPVRFVLYCVAQVRFESFRSCNDFCCLELTPFVSCADSRSDRCFRCPARRAARPLARQLLSAEWHGSRSSALLWSVAPETYSSFDWRSTEFDGNNLLKPWAEMFLTFGLCMTVIMLAVEKNKSTPLAPLAIGLALFSTQLAGINFTGASVNTGMTTPLLIAVMKKELAGLGSPLR